MRTRNDRVAVRLATALILGAISAGAIGVTAAWAGEDDGGIGLTVTVQGTTAAPAPPGPKTAGSARNTGGTVVSGPSSGPAPVAEPDEFDLGGIVFLSGVRSDYGWNVNPFDGRAHVSMTIRNVSHTTFDSTASFSLVGPLGNELSRIDDVEITGLKPDESRVIDATLTGIGQWTFVSTHATFTPPPSVEGTALGAITRDGWLFVPPWLLLAFAGLGSVAYWVVRIVVRNAAYGPDAPRSAAGPGQGIV